MKKIMSQYSFDYCFGGLWLDTYDKQNFEDTLRNFFEVVGPGETCGLGNKFTVADIREGLEIRAEDARFVSEVLNRMVAKGEIQKYTRYHDGKGTNYYYTTKKKKGSLEDRLADLVPVKIADKPLKDYTDDELIAEIQRRLERERSPIGY